MAATPVKGMSILFTGDSITDCGRRTDVYQPMGRGYAFLASSWLSAMYPELGLTFINKGISGDRVAGLAARWTKDCIKLQPSLVSILIGVNDTWRRFDRDDPTSADAFEADYRRLLEQTKRETNAFIVICEPFLLNCGLVDDAWRADLTPKIEAGRRLAQEFAALYIPLNDLFAQASARARPDYWAQDGVHPTAAGHAFIARAWLKHVFDIG
jgi:lysophospholipase L1-like esterase